MGKCVHAIPGRARFSVPAIRKSTTVAAALVRGLRAMDGVEEVDLRAGSASIVVHYDPRRLCFDSLCAYMSGQTEQAARPRRADIALAERRPTMASHLGGSSAVLGTARHIGGVIRSTAFKVILEKAVQTGVRRLLRNAPVRL